MIYYVALDNPHPSGGVKTQYRHVELLNAAGRPAAMLHQTPGFTAATWFHSTAPIRYGPQTEVQPGDVLVWPEILRGSIEPVEGVTHLIFNQNVHYSWRPGGGESGYPHSAVATMVLTEYEREFLAWAAPGHPVYLVRHGIDPALWADDGRPKWKQIAYMPRKHADEAQAVFGWLRNRDALSGWSLVSIDGQSEANTAEILKNSAVFFAFGYPEGGTLPPFEALAAGCVVIGYGGFASDADLRRCGGVVVPSGNTCAFARKAAGYLGAVERYPRPGISKGTLDYFSLEQERDALLAVFAALP